MTNAPPCVYGAPNWHDVAGALVTADGTFHVFQGCAGYGGVQVRAVCRCVARTCRVRHRPYSHPSPSPSQAGWHHATSSNLVDWVNHGIEPTLAALPEPYGTSSPCRCAAAAVWRGARREWRPGAGAADEARPAGSSATLIKRQSSPFSPPPPLHHSGFMVVDDDGIPCAGFRECGGNWPGRGNTQVQW